MRFSPCFGHLNSGNYFLVYYKLEVWCRPETSSTFLGRCNSPIRMIKSMRIIGGGINTFGKAKKLPVHFGRNDKKGPHARILAERVMRKVA